MLQAENIMLVEKQKVEKDQNTQLRNQIAHLLQLEQEQKMQIHERDVVISTLQVKSCTIIKLFYLICSHFSYKSLNFDFVTQY